MAAKTLSTAVMLAACCLALGANMLNPVVRAFQEQDDVVFEVASIRINKDGPERAGYRVAPDGRFTATKLTLRDLILQAYQIQRIQLEGGPQWVQNERFDIDARATGELTNGGARTTLPGALRTLLKERFGLVEHIELREFPVYALRVVREGRLGPRISPSDVNCAAIPLSERKPGQCTVSAPGADGRYYASSAPISDLVASVRAAVDRPIVDETGLKGNFKMDLTWTSTRLSTALGPSSDTAAPDPLTDGSIFTAIQDQLGLKLVQTTAPIPVLVIDAVEYPTNY